MKNVLYSYMVYGIGTTQIFIVNVFYLKFYMTIILSGFENIFLPSICACASMFNPMGFIHVFISEYYYIGEPKKFHP